MSQEVNSFSQLLEIIKPLGPWQWSCYAMLGFTLLSAGAINTANVFFAYDQPHHCMVNSLLESEHQLAEEEAKKLALPPSEDGKGYDSCHLYNLTQYSNFTRMDYNMTALNSSNLEKVPCNGWTYDTSTMKTTIVSDFNLVCGNQAHIAASQSVYMAGILVGSIIIGTVADLIGRARAFCSSGVIFFVFGIALPFVHSYPIFLALRFFLAVGIVGCWLSGFVLANELTSAKHRTWVGSCYFLPVSFGQLLLALLAYLIRDWRILHIVLAVPNIIFLPYFWLLSESPRWLLASGRVDQAKVVIEKAARMNKAKLPPNLDYEEISHDLSKERSRGFIRGCSNECCSLIRIPLYVVRLIIVAFNWFVISMVYYGLLWNVGALDGNIFINMAFSSLAGFPSYAVNLILMKWGRRSGLIAAQVVVGLSFLVTLGVPAKLSGLRLALFLVGRCLSNSTFTIVYCYTTELYPTVVRNTIQGTSSMAARMGSILSPYIIIIPSLAMKGSEHARRLSMAPPIILGVLSVLAAITVCLLPETKGKHMPDHIEGGLQNRSWFEKKVFGHSAKVTSRDPGPVETNT